MTGWRIPWASCALGAVMLVSGTRVGAATELIAPPPPPVVYSLDSQPCAREIPPEFRGASGGPGRDSTDGAGSSGPVELDQLSLPVTSVEFSENGTRLLTSNGVRVTVHGAEDRRVVRWLQAVGKPFSAARLSPDGLTVAVIENPGAFSLYEVATGKRLLSVPLSAAPAPGAIAFRPDGKRVAVTDGRHIVLLDAATGTRVGRLSGSEQPNSRRVTYGHADQVIDLAFAPGAAGRVLLSVSLDGTLRLWDAAAQRQLRCFEIRSGGQPVDPEFTAAAFSPDGRTIAAATKWGAYLWRATDGGFVQRILSTESFGFSDVEFSPEGGRLLTAGRDKMARIYSLDTGLLAGSFEHREDARAAAFHPSGRRIIVGYGAYGSSTTGQPRSGARLWDLQQ